MNQHARPDHRTIRPGRVRLLTLVLTLASVVLAGASCSDDTTDSSSAARSTTAAPSTSTERAAPEDGDTQAFCAAGETINAKTASITGPEQAVSIFTELDPTLETMLTTAPPAVATAAKTFVSTARSAVASGDFTPFEDGTVDALVEQFDAVCSGN